VGALKVHPSFLFQYINDYCNNNFVSFHSIRFKKDMRRITCILVTILSFGAHALSQQISNPNSGLKSPETLELKSIELSGDKTVISFSLQNLTSGGYFCADKNIFIIYPDGTKLKLTADEGIPQCPDTYKFKNIGEKLAFKLTFPPLKSSTEWIDIVEECSDNCFYFYGVTLNADLNKRLDEAFMIATKGDPQKNMLLFRGILDSVDKQNPGIKGLLYINIITAAMEAGDKVEATVWYKRLLSSKSPRLNQYVKYLNDKGIKF
jgi:hypothetical protein